MQKKIVFNDRDFFKEPFSREEIISILAGKPAKEMFNFRSPSFKKLGLDAETLGDDRLIDLMLGEPRLVRRPVVRIGDTAHFGADVKTLEKLL